MPSFLFVMSKIYWFVVNPVTLLLVLAVVGLVCLWLDRHRSAKILLTLLVAVMVSLYLLPIGQWVVGPLESRFSAVPLPPQVTGIIVLGASVDPTLSRLRGQPVINDSGERILAVARLSRQYPQARMIYSGGSSSVVFNRDDREADYAALVLADMGVASSRLEFERNSRNTFENAVYCKALAQPKPGEVWLLVTSAIHMPRAVGLFRGQGFAVVPYSVDYRTAPWTGGVQDYLAPGGLVDGLQALKSGGKEWVGLLAVWIFGQSSELFPGP
ncbi:MAG: YdcF family protein [Candidatus Pacebacteria bacterium]|nr:YdcF family protein [Candidatus Paceibacterota bacterium]